MNVQFTTKIAVSLILLLFLIPHAPQKSIFLSAPLQECSVPILIGLLGEYRGEDVIVSLSAGCVLSSPGPTACSWFSLSNDFGLAAMIITQLGSGKSRPVADAWLIATGCVWRLEDLL